MAWTDNQKLAIDSREGNFLVSAGAGSGKTAVLTQRITDIIANKQAEISEFLVLTFSNKAAHEMKTRIRKSLKKNGMIEASEQVELADITTFDAFARKVVIKYADFLGVDPNFNVIDDTYLESFKRDRIEELIEMFIASDPKFREMMKHFCIKDDRHVIELISKIQKFADKFSNRGKVYQMLARNVVDKEFVDVCIDVLYEDINAHIHEAIDLTDHYQDENLADIDRTLIECFADLGSYDAFFEKAKLSKSNKELQFKRLSKTFTTDEMTKSVRKNTKDLLNGYIDLVLSYGDSTNQRARLAETLEDITPLIRLSIELDTILEAYKVATSSWTFSDIFSMACRAVANENIRQEIRSKYKFIMLDEYQDTNQLQEDFIGAIANNNTFAVGDIKQSIYRFRNAEPSIFSGKFNRYGRNEGGTLIKLQDNFRSRKEVVDDINNIFGACMSNDLGSVDYSDGHCFNWGNKALYSATCSDEHNLDWIIYEDTNKNSRLTDPEREAMVIANDIISKIESHYQVLGGDGKMRDCTPSDFAILISRKSNFSAFKRVFAEAKIPLAVSEDADLSSDNVSMTFVSLLRLFNSINGTEKYDSDIEKFSYVSLMRSYLFSKPDKEIFESIKSGAYKVSELFATVLENRDRLYTMSVKDATIEMLHMFPFVDNLKKIGDVKANYEKLKSIVNVAASIDSVGASFPEFVKYFDDLEEYGLQMKVKSSGEAGGGVQLMSVHASKGLEFPIIYCPDLARKANKDDSKGMFALSDHYGLALPKAKSDEYPKNMLHYLISEEDGAEANNEFLRLFYVDLTRAKEKIILVSKKHKDFIYERINSWQILKVTTKVNEKGETVYNSSLQNCDSFEKYLALANQPLRKIEVEVKQPQELKIGAVEVRDVPAPEFRSVKVEAVVKERKKASKTSVEPVDEGALAYGTRLHRLLEVVDFKTKDTSFIFSEKERATIDRVLALPVFDDISNAKVYHEYEFYDEDENIHGSIDLLLVFDDYAYIIDYKTKHIDDPAYEKQLSIYKSFVERKFGLRTRAGLLSIIGAEFKSVL